MRLLRRVLFRDAPSTSDFWAPPHPTGCRSGPLQPPPPLHLKDVGQAGGVSYNRVAALHVDHHECKEFFQRQRRWAEDVELYTDLFQRNVKGSRVGLPDRRPRFAFSDDDCSLMNGRKFDLIDPDDAQPYAYCDGWSRPEKENTRRRPLFEPHINDQFGEHDLEQMRQSTITEVRHNSARHRYALLYDFSAWYDQLLLSPQVRRFFGVRLRDGRVGTLRAMAMGFKGSCHLAQSITWMLVDFLDSFCRSERVPRESVAVDTCIDNVRFTALSAETLVRVGIEFRRRCAYVGAVLNEDADAPSLPLQQYEHLGAAYDHSTPVTTRTIAEKSRRKLIIASDCLHARTLTRRQLAAVFGIIFYAADTVAPDSLAEHFDALRHYRKHISTCDEHDGRVWSELLVLPVDIKAELQLWLSTLVNAAPIPAESPRAAYDLIIATDACETGWGAVGLDLHNGSIHSAAGSWQSNDMLWTLARSVESEPLGMLKGALRFVSSKHKSVLLLTDHVGAMYAVQQGLGKARAYNHLVLRLRELWPNCRFDCAHIAGSSNPADPLSRGLVVAPLSTAKSLELRDEWTDRAAQRQAEYGIRAVGHGVWMV